MELRTCDILKRTGTARHRAASSCNAFAIATFSSFYYYCYFLQFCLHRVLLSMFMSVLAI